MCQKVNNRMERTNMIMQRKSWCWGMGKLGVDRIEVNILIGKQ